MTITVIWDAFIDITVPMGTTNPGDTVERNLSFQCGGTANVSRGILQCGGKSIFLGKIGNDPFGHYFKENLKDSNINDLVFLDTTHPTGLCISMVYANGERTFFVNRGANDFFSLEDFKKKNTVIEKSEIIYISGYSLQSENNRNVLTNILDICHENKQIIIFNPGAPNLINETYMAILKKYADILICNLDEGKKLSKTRSQENVIKRIKKIINFSVVTCGSGGCFCTHEGRQIHVKTNSINILDTTGAGDAFSAAFIVGLTKGNSAEESCELGNSFSGKWLLENNRKLSIH